MKVFKNIIRVKGIFKILYVDKAGCFGGTKNQLEDACNQLGIQRVDKVSMLGRFIGHFPRLGI